MNDLLRIENLKKHYEGFDLKDVSLSVPTGSMVGLIGSNGAGKTTTIKALLGLIIPDGGSLRLFDEKIGPSCPRRLAALKQRIGIVFDVCPFPSEFSIEAIGKLMTICYEQWSPSLFQKYQREFDLPRNKTVKELSRGMGMKLQLACALAHEPDLLILDEPTAGLDPLARNETLDILRDFMIDEKHGILMSSHITTDLEKTADYIVCIDAGHIVFSMPKDDITECAGIAHCRAAEFDELAAKPFFKEQELSFERNRYGIELLVPNRQTFAAQFPHIALDRAEIDTYMELRLKGELI